MVFPFQSYVFQREAGSPLAPTSPRQLVSGIGSVLLVEETMEKPRVCVWWVGLGSGDLGAGSALPFVMG